MGLIDNLKSLLHSKRVDIDQRFELMREAVSGTMSDFYMARDRKTKQIVGLKVGILEKTTAFEARFKGLKKPSEGEIATSLKHPRIVESYEYGVTTEGQPYLVMEYLHGPGLHALLYIRDPVLEGKRAKIVRQMAEAVDTVHKAGYIHRDVCPRNFIYLPESESVKMIDFGLTVPATPEFMQPGNRTGTPLYMAPELVRRRPTDQRLDIFAFGVTAYQICTNEFPWPVTETSGLAAMAHDTQEPTDILRYRPTLNRTLAEAITDCMAPKPDDRTQTMEDFLRQIRKVESDDEPQ